MVHFFDFDRADGMLDHQQRMVWRAESLSLRFRQSIERMGDQRDRETSALLDLD